MKTKIFNLVFPISASALSGFLLVLAFPTYDLGWLAWVGLAPLLLAISGIKSRYGFFLSFLCGLIFFFGIFNWILQVSGYTFLHHALLGVYLGVYFGLFGLMFSFVSGRWGITPALLTAPFLWVCLEYVKSNLSFLALPWGLLAHSQYGYPQVIQVASITGTYGLSFLIVLANAAVTVMLFPVLYRARKSILSPYQSFGKQGSMGVVCTATILAMLNLLYGFITTSKPAIGKTIKVSVVQGNIEQAKKWDPKYANFIMQTYAKLTEEASKDQPALIIWPEAATPRAINVDSRLYSQVRCITESAGAYLLLGSSHRQKFKLKGPMDIKFANSAFLINPEKRTENQRYDKIHLLPFGEYLPHREIIPWSYIKVPDVGSYMPGEEFTIFRHPSFRFGVTICWEDIFPELVRRLVKGGAQFIVNITNEAWFGRTAASYQFVSMSVFRAVENRLYVLRCANTGVSCFIDPYGRVIDRVIDNRGQDIFVRGVLTRSIVPMESKTIYTRYGDWFVWLCFACSAAFLLLVFLRKNP